MQSILLVEDDKHIVDNLTDYLEGEGFRVRSAEGQAQALERLEGERFDLVLLDISLSDGNGFAVCSAVKALYQLPVIFLTASGDEYSTVTGFEVGADDYIPKPFAMNVVAAKIRNLFRTRRRAIEYYSQSMDIEPEKIALNPMDEKLLKQAMEIMEKHMDDVDFTTDEFAREMCMSRSNLHLKMKALTGESTNEFIRKMRFNKACKLLKEGTYTIAEISTMVGFSTPSYFSTSFKKHFGCLPSEYGK